MRRSYLLPIAATISLALLSACSKPATETAADASAATAAAAQDTAGAGGAVSPPAANGAVNTDANTASSDVAAASNSFTEDQARGHIENAGYTDVSTLTKTPEGLWTGTAKKGGKSMDVSVDFKGAVATK